MERSFGHNVLSHDELNRILKNKLRTKKPRYRRSTSAKVDNKTAENYYSDTDSSTSDSETPVKCHMIKQTTLDDEKKDCGNEKNVQNNGRYQDVPGCQSDRKKVADREWNITEKLLAGKEKMKWHKNTKLRRNDRKNYEKQKMQIQRRAANKKVACDSKEDRSSNFELSLKEDGFVNSPATLTELNVRSCEDSSLPVNDAGKAYTTIGVDKGKICDKQYDLADKYFDRDVNFTQKLCDGFIYDTKKICDMIPHCREKAFDSVMDSTLSKSCDKGKGYAENTWTQIVDSTDQIRHEEKSLRQTKTSETDTFDKGEIPRILPQGKTMMVTDTCNSKGHLVSEDITQQVAQSEVIHLCKDDHKMKVDNQNDKPDHCRVRRLNPDEGKEDPDTVMSYCLNGDSDCESMNSLNSMKVRQGGDLCSNTEAGCVSSCGDAKCQHEEVGEASGQLRGLKGVLTACDVEEAEEVQATVCLFSQMTIRGSCSSLRYRRYKLWSNAKNGQHGKALCPYKPDRVGGGFSLKSLCKQISVTRVGRMRRKMRKRKQKQAVRKGQHHPSVRQTRGGQHVQEPLRRFKYRCCGDSNNNSSGRQKSNVTNTGVARGNKRGNNGCQTSVSGGGGEGGSGGRGDDDDDEGRPPRHKSTIVTQGHYLEYGVDQSQGVGRHSSRSDGESSYVSGPNSKSEIQQRDLEALNPEMYQAPDTEPTAQVSMMRYGPYRITTVSSNEQEWSSHNETSVTQTVSENTPENINTFFQQKPRCQKLDKTSKHDDSGIGDTSAELSPLKPCMKRTSCGSPSRGKSGDSDLPTPDSGLPRSISGSSSRSNDVFSEWGSPVQSPGSSDSKVIVAPEMRLATDKTISSVGSVSNTKTTEDVNVQKLGNKLTEHLPMDKTKYPEDLGLNSGTTESGGMKVIGDNHIDQIAVRTVEQQVTPTVKALPSVDIVSDTATAECHSMKKQSYKTLRQLEDMRISEETEESGAVQKPVKILSEDSKGLNDLSRSFYEASNVSSGEDNTGELSTLRKPCVGEACAERLTSEQKQQASSGRGWTGEKLADEVRHSDDTKSEPGSVDSEDTIVPENTVFDLGDNSESFSDTTSILRNIKINEPAELTDKVIKDTGKIQSGSEKHLKSFRPTDNTSMCNSMESVTGDTDCVNHAEVVNSSKLSGLSKSQITNTGSVENYKGRKKKDVDKFGLPMVEEQDTDGETAKEVEENNRTPEKCPNIGFVQEPKEVVERQCQKAKDSDPSESLSNAKKQTEIQSTSQETDVNLHPAIVGRPTRDIPDGQDGQRTPVVGDVATLIKEAEVIELLGGRETDEFRKSLKDMCSSLSNFCTGCRQSSFSFCFCVTLLKHFVACINKSESCDRCKTVLCIWKNHHDYLEHKSSSSYRYRENVCHIEICQKSRKKKQTADRHREKKQCYSMGSGNSLVSLTCSTSEDVQKLKRFFLKLLRDHGHIGQSEMQQIHKLLSERERLLLLERGHRNQEENRKLHISGATFAGGETILHPRVRTLREKNDSRRVSSIPAPFPSVSSLQSLLGEEDTEDEEVGHFNRSPSAPDHMTDKDVRFSLYPDEDGMTLANEVPPTVLTLRNSQQDLDTKLSLPENRGDQVRLGVLYGNVQDLIFKAGVWMDIRETLEDTGMLPSSTEQAEGYILDSYRDILRIDEKVSQYEQDIHYDSVVYLGSGVSGQCYLMKDRESQQKFCIKIVQLLLFDSEEMMIWSELNHPNVVKLYGVLRKQTEVFFIAEYIEGTTLKDAIIQQKGLNASVAMCYMRDILLALCHLQEKQVLHEDLKADNIMLRTSEGRMTCVLIDFGVSRKLDEFSTPYVENESPVGAATHWSPEKARSDRYSHNADVWAAFCNLIHMLAGVEPWIRRFEIREQLLLKIAQSSIGPLEDLPMNTDWRVMEFIRYGMDINPDQRPTASQLLRHPIFQLLGFEPENIPTVVQDENLISMESLRTPSLTPEQNRRMAEGNLPTVVDNYRQSKTDEYSYQEESQILANTQLPVGSQANQQTEAYPTVLLGMGTSITNDHHSDRALIHNPVNHSHSDIMHAEDHYRNEIPINVQSPPNEQYIVSLPEHGNNLPVDMLFDSLSTAQQVSTSIEDEYKNVNQMFVDSLNFNRTGGNATNDGLKSTKALESRDREEYGGVEFSDENVEEVVYDDYTIPDLSEFAESNSRISESDLDELLNPNDLVESPQEPGSTVTPHQTSSKNQVSRTNHNDNITADLEELQGATAMPAPTFRQSRSNIGDNCDEQPRFWHRERANTENQEIDDFVIQEQIQIFRSFSQSPYSYSHPAPDSEVHHRTSPRRSGRGDVSHAFDVGSSGPSQTGNHGVQSTSGRRNQSNSSYRNRSNMGNHGRSLPRNHSRAPLTLDWGNGSPDNNVTPDEVNPRTLENTQETSSSRWQSQATAIPVPSEYMLHSPYTNRPPQTNQQMRNVPNLSEFGNGISPGLTSTPKSGQSMTYGDSTMHKSKSVVFEHQFNPVNIPDARRSSSPFPDRITLQNPLELEENQDLSFSTAPSGVSGTPPLRSNNGIFGISLHRNSPARNDHSSFSEFRERSGSTCESRYSSWQAEELKKKVKECEAQAHNELFERITQNSHPEDVTEKFHRSLSESYHTATDANSHPYPLIQENFLLNRSVSSSNGTGVKVEFCTSELKVLQTFRLRGNEDGVTWEEAVKRVSHMLHEDSHIEEFTVFLGDSSQCPLDLTDLIPSSHRLLQVIVHPLTPRQRFRWKVVGGQIMYHLDYSPQFPYTMGTN